MLVVSCFERWKRGVWQFGSPHRDRQIPRRAKSRCRNRISINYNAAPLTSFRFPATKQPRPEFCRTTWGGRKRDLQRRFFRPYRGGLTADPSLRNDPIRRLFRRLSIIGRAGGVAE